MVRESFYRCLRQLNTRDTAVRWRDEDQAPPQVRQRIPSAEYLSGFMDAEGSFMIVKSKSRPSRELQIRARISVVSTDSAVIEDIQKAYGGVIVSQPGRKSNWNPTYQLVWTDGMVEPLLRSIRPH
jgi:hypothetical protein